MLHLLATCLVTAITAHAEIPLDGVWQTVGYARIIEIQGNFLRVYQITSLSCMRAELATRRPHAQTGVTVFANRAGDKFRIHTDSAGTWMNEGGLSDVALERVARRPPLCDRPTENTPQNNYAIFWQTFAENYPFFPLHGVDWVAVDRTYRPRVTAHTTQTELFDVFRAMLAPLHDAHTFVAANDLKREFSGYRGRPSAPTPAELKRERQRMGGPRTRSYCKGLLHYSRLPEGIGYLRLDAMSDRCNVALDKIFRHADTLSALIIDVRTDEGGSDAFAIALASRLTAKQYLAYAKGAARTTPHNVMVPVSHRPGFRGPVAMLTGLDTLSAGETFAMAMMGREPHVVRVGQDTQGVFSDVLSRKLPNGWQFVLPNEVYLTADGKSFDGVGVPAEVHVTAGAEQRAVDILRAIPP